jgi:hypothetical protein
MPRTARKQYAGARYHVHNRGNGRQALFYRPDDYERFLDQLREVLGRDGVVLYAYCLMPNHVQRIATAVAEAYGVRSEALPCARKRVGMARGVFIELACTLGGLTQRAVARRLGTMGEHGVGKQRGQVRAALAGNAGLNTALAEPDEVGSASASSANPAIQPTPL